MYIIYALVGGYPNITVHDYNGMVNFGVYKPSECVFMVPGTVDPND
jgi:hypothetical protein